MKLLLIQRNLKNQKIFILLTEKTMMEIYMSGGKKFYGGEENLENVKLQLLIQVKLMLQLLMQVKMMHQLIM